jgi:hypothetical protein
MKHTHIYSYGAHASLCGIFDAWIPPRNVKATCKTCRKLERKGCKKRRSYV